MTNEEPTNMRPARPQLPPIEEREFQQVLWEISDAGVLAITFNRPERLNALSYRLLREVAQLIRHAGSNDDIRVVTLRGAGTLAFCSGDDLKGMEPELSVDSSATVHHPLITAIRELPKPVVGLVSGWALGHGFELACACDLRLCADNVEVGDHRVQRAIALNGGSSWFLPRIVGQGRALEMLMTGRHLDATEALAWGWANHVWELDEFDERSAEYVAMLAELPTIDAGVFKAAIEYSSAHGLRDSLANELIVSRRNQGTLDAVEGMASFHEKRTPTFFGR
ncbi:MAG TPA: enoyl-CoA hydratase-related protein [Dehalococcoidia bacterium]|nr:enoyl-CoA hydratase-related protein [Dehalococcoidia bacterium]